MLGGGIQRIQKSRGYKPDEPPMVGGTGTIDADRDTVPSLRATTRSNRRPIART
jgi:hypothetical protein